MAYIAPTVEDFRLRTGTRSEKLVAELKAIQTELSTIETGASLNQSKFAVLTTGVGNPAALATTGIDFGTAADIFVYGAFVAPVDIQIVKMHDTITEAYLKDAADAKLEIYDNGGSPTKLFGRTLAAAGEAVNASHHTDPETGTGNVTAGTRLDLKAVNTGASGTGHAIVLLEYVER